MRDVSIENLDGVLETLTKLVDEKEIAQALGQACALVERSAKQKAPKGNGELRRSITSSVVGDTGIVFTPLEYAPYVEYGTGLFAEGGNGRKDVPWHYQDDEGEWHSTSGQNPSPFLRPALNENREQIKRILKGGLMKK
jgi:HK97 gp10 family phage protein